MWMEDGDEATTSVVVSFVSTMSQSGPVSEPFFRCF